MRSFFRLFMPVISLVTLIGSAVAQDRPDLLRGIDSVPAMGTPGLLAVWGKDSFSVLAAKDGPNLAPVIAAGRLGKGRLVCIAHDGYVGRAAAPQNASLLRNLVLWAAGELPNRKPIVGLITAPCAAVLNDVATVEPLDGEWHKLLPAFDVIVIGGWRLNPSQVAALTSFVERGGGLVAGQTAWAWTPTPGQSLEDNPLNRLAAGAGIAWTGSYSGHTAPGGFKPEAGTDAIHAALALDLIEAGTPEDSLRQASASVVNAATVLPAGDVMLRPRLNALLEKHSAALVPSEKKPMGPRDGLARVLLAFQVRELRRHDAPAAHPAAAEFPGAVASDASRAERDVCLSGAERWNSTGLYAAPGEAITVTVPREAVGLKAGVRIGCHQDQLWHHREWKRVPEITGEWPIISERTVVTSAFGGPIYIVLPRGAREQTRIRIAGAVEAPMFVRGKTDPAAWKESIRHAPAPWAELATERVILSVPSSHVRDLDNPEELLAFWDAILDAQADLAGIPRERPWPQRYVADVQISAGYMHSGYPIMTHLDAAADMASLSNMKKGPWGLLHEMGHNHQEGDWTFDGTGEVTCNLFAMYCIETVCGLPWREGHEGLRDSAKRIAKHRATGRSFEKWKEDPFLALAMYAQLVEAFGWETFKRVFAEYRALSRDERPRTEEAKRDQWMVRFSRACGRNLGPFFDDWGVPVSAEAKASIADLPGWMPE
ncbi:MAG: hypothetical protein JNK25_03010 [Phycisphaerae bacterium]|nr:hypothetical protein [Phycisphaerae bacterium]